MKNIIKITLALFIIYHSSFITIQAQVSISPNNSTPDASAMLDVQSTDKGMLIPRMDSTSRNAIAAPAVGLLVYDSTTTSFWYYDQMQWNEIRNGSQTITPSDLLGEDVEPDFSCLAVVTNRSIEDGPESLTLYDNYAYIPDDNGVLQIFDLSDPTSPTLSNSFNIGGFPQSVAVLGDYAYVVSQGSDDLKVIDVSDKANPSVTGSIGLGGSPFDVAISDDYIYAVGAFGNNLKVIDVSDKANPSLSGSLGIGSFPISIAIQDDYAYIIDLDSDDLKVVNISDKINPSISGSLSIGGFPKSIAVSDNYAYIVDEDSDDLKVIDVSDKTNPSLSGSLGIGNGSQSVAVSSDYAYVTDASTNDLKVININDKANPSLIDSLVVGGNPISVGVSGNYAYVVESSSEKLKTVQLSCADKLIAFDPLSGTFEIATDSDDQTIDKFNLNGTTLELSLEDDGQADQTVDLASINTVQSIIEDADGDTKIQVEESADEDVIRFDLGSSFFGSQYFLMKPREFVLQIDEPETNAQITFDSPSGTASIEADFSLSFPLTRKMKFSVLDKKPLILESDGAVIINQNYTLPRVDGMMDQIMQTDGQGNLNWVDIPSAVDTDDQTIDKLNLNGTTLELSLEDDGQTDQTVDLASIDTDTDDQTIDKLNLNGTTLELSLEDDGQADQMVDLASIDTDTDDQTIDKLNLNGTTLELSLEDDGQADQMVDLASIDTDDQTIDVLNLNGTTLEISLADDGEATQTLDLASINSTQTIIEDADSDTKIQVEESADEDIIRFDIGGTEQMRLEANADGYARLELSTTGNNIFIGDQTGRDLTEGIANTYIGTFAGEKDSASYDNVFIGHAAGRNHKFGDDNVFLGRLAGRDNINGFGNLFLGYSAGFSEAGGNKLYIENSSSASPLIYGEFDNDLVRINGDFEITGNAKGIIPVGTVEMYVGTTAPDGWLLCDGSTFDINIYPELNTLLGGNTLPDFSGRFPIGVGDSGETGSTNHALSTTGGEETHTLTVGEMPIHGHTVNIGYREGEEQGSGNDYSDLGAPANEHTNNKNYDTSLAGNGNAHNNMPPFYTINFIIKAE